MSCPHASAAAHLWETCVWSSWLTCSPCYLLSGARIQVWHTGCYLSPFFPGENVFWLIEKLGCSFTQTRLHGSKPSRENHWHWRWCYLTVQAHCSALFIFVRNKSISRKLICSYIDFWITKMSNRFQILKSEYLPCFMYFLGDCYSPINR